MKIWKFEEVGGQEFEVSEGYPVMFPFTDVAPLEDYPLNNKHMFQLKVNGYSWET